MPENPPLPETSPLPESPPLPESSPLSEDSPLAPGGAALLLHKSAIKYQQRQGIHAHLTSGNQTLYLHWGLLWRKVAGSGKVVSGAPPAVAVGSSLMTITGDLGPLCCSLGQSPKEEQVQRKVNEIQNKQQGLKNCKYSKRSLLFFFFLVGAERGEVEVRRTPGVGRRRRSFPWPLGGSSGGGLRRPRSGCRPQRE